VGRQLDPSFKVVDHALPLVRSVVARRHAPDALVRWAATAGREALHALHEVPRDLAEITRRARADGLQIQFIHRNLDHFIHEMDRSSNRLSRDRDAAVVVGSAGHADRRRLRTSISALGLRARRPRSWDRSRDWHPGSGSPDRARGFSAGGSIDCVRPDGKIGGNVNG
jgi:hypothetical protein